MNWIQRSILLVALVGGVSGCKAQAPASGTPVTEIAATQAKPAAPETSQTSLPSDVKTFLARREICDHFRGEDPYDGERAAFLNRKMDESCTGTDAELARLRKTYRDAPEIIARLFSFDDTIE